MTAGPQVTVQVAGGRRVRRELQRLKTKLLNRKEPHDRSGRLMQERTQRRIREGRSVRGRRLQDLDESTLAWRRVRGIPSTKVLIEEGNLLRSIRFRVVRGRETRTEVEPKRKKEKGLLAIHQRGIGVPRREVLGINSTDERNVRKIFSDFISSELERL